MGCIDNDISNFPFTLGIQLNSNTSCKYSSHQYKAIRELRELRLLLHFFICAAGDVTSNISKIDGNYFITSILYSMAHISKVVQDIENVRGPFNTNIGWNSLIQWNYICICASIVPNDLCQDL